MAVKKIPIVMDVKTLFDNKAFDGFKRSFSKLTKSEKSPFEQINTDITKMSRLISILDSYKLNTGNVEDYERKIQELNEVIETLTKNFANINLDQSFNTEEISKKTQELLKIKEDIAKKVGANSTGSIKPQSVGLLQKQYEEALKTFEKKYGGRNKNNTRGRTKASKALERLGTRAAKEKASLDKSWEKINEIEEELKQLQELSPEVQSAYRNIGLAIEKASSAQKEFGMQLKEDNKRMQELSAEEATKSIKNFATRFLGLGAVLHTAHNQLRQLIDTFKTLDAGLTQIALVSGRTRDEVWGMIGTYNEMAQRLGVTTNNVVESSKLYYQQGRSQSEVMELVEQTTILATISEIDFADATEYMTAAINGFNLEAEQAVEVTDVWSNLSAQAAVDADELALSMSKVASLASNAGMSLETTSAFLTQMINFATYTRVA